jgi:hypothetical protein
MKTLPTLALGAVVSAMLLVVPAAAQQQQQQSTIQSHSATPNPTVNGRVIPRFPMTSAQYEHNVGKLLDVLHKAKPTGPITSGDLNKAILIVRDCASNAEADGVVTQKEAQFCRAQLTQFKRERLREVMATSTPEQWARWRAAIPNPGNDNE